MPYTEVMHKYKEGKLHSGSEKGPTVTKKSQAIAIMLSEKQKANEGKKEYKPKKYANGGTVETAGASAVSPSGASSAARPPPPPKYNKGGEVTKHSDRSTWRRW